MAPVGVVLWCNYLTCLSDTDWTFAGCWWEGLFSGLCFWKGIASHPSWQTQTITERMSALLWDLSNTQPCCVSPLGLLWSGSKNPGVPSYWNSAHFQHLAWKLGITPNSCWKLLIPIIAIRNKALLTQAKGDLDLSLFFTISTVFKKTVPDPGGEWCPRDATPIQCVRNFKRHLMVLTASFQA